MLKIKIFWCLKFGIDTCVHLHVTAEHSLVNPVQKNMNLIIVKLFSLCGGRGWAWGIKGSVCCSAIIAGSSWFEYSVNKKEKRKYQPKNYPFTSYIQLYYSISTLTWKYIIVQWWGTGQWALTSHSLDSLIFLSYTHTYSRLKKGADLRGQHELQIWSVIGYRNQFKEFILCALRSVLFSRLYR